MVDQTQLARKFQKELNAGIASLVLLSVLNRSAEPMYGYQIARLLEGYTGEDSFVKQGALYPVLHSLEAGGLLESNVEPSVSGPPRRYYQITGDGREALASWREIWEQMRGFVDQVTRGE
ncbi:MAG TPA: PadR family transcriptional regulator [Anaerolineales bacterium]